MFLDLFHKDAPFFTKTLLEYLDIDGQLLLSKVDTQMIHVVRTLYLFFFSKCESLALFDHSFFTLSQYENHLTFIDCGNVLEELEGIEECTQLTELCLSWCEHLEYIDNYYNLNLTPLVNLTKLDLGTSNIKELEPLRNVVQLTELDLSYNNINDITDLKLLTNLVSLDLNSQFNARYETNTICLQPLTHLVQLKRLNISGFWKKSIASLYNLTHLKILILGNMDSDTLIQLKNTLVFTNIKQYASSSPLHTLFDTF